MRQRFRPSHLPFLDGADPLIEPLKVFAYQVEKRIKVFDVIARHGFHCGG
jgi:hypothetical protein